jgi:hypothetical protein
MKEEASAFDGGLKPPAEKLVGGMRGRENMTRGNWWALEAEGEETRAANSPSLLTGRKF